MSSLITWPLKMAVSSFKFTITPLLNNITFGTNRNPEEYYFWPITFQTDLSILIPTIVISSVLLFLLLLYCNYKFYCQRVKKNSKFLKKRGNKGLIRHRILLTIFKCIIIGLIYVGQYVTPKNP